MSERRSHAEILFGNAPSNTVAASSDADTGDELDDDDTEDDDTDDDGSEDDDDATSGGASAASPPPRPMTPARPTTPSRPRTHAEILFGTTADTAPGLGPEMYLDGRITENIAKVADRLGWTTEQQYTEKRAFADLALNELGLEHDQAHLLHDVITEARLKGGTKAWKEQTQQWAAQSRRELRERHGPAQAEALTQELHAYAKQHPLLQALLVNGVGAHPKIVTMFATHIQRVGRRG